MRKSKELTSLIKVRSILKVSSCITKYVLAIICSNSYSHCEVDQKKTVAISLMFKRETITIICTLDVFIKY